MISFRSRLAILGLSFLLLLFLLNPFHIYGTVFLQQTDVGWPRWPNLAHDGSVLGFVFLFFL